MAKCKESNGNDIFSDWIESYYIFKGPGHVDSNLYMVLVAVLYPLGIFYNLLGIGCV